MPQVKRYGGSGSYILGKSLRLCTALSTFSSSWMQWELKALSTFWDLAQNNCFQMGLQYLILVLKQLQSSVRREGWHCYEKKKSGILSSLSREPEQLPFDLERKLRAQVSWTLQIWDGFACLLSSCVWEAGGKESLSKSPPHLQQNCSAEWFGTSSYTSLCCSELTHKDEGASGINQQILWSCN